MERINLLPRELCPGLKVNLRRLAVMGAAILAVVLILAAYLGCLWHISQLQEQTDDLQRQLSGLNIRAGLTEDTRLEKEKYQAMAHAYAGLVNGQQNWLDMLLEIDKWVPAEVWLTGIKINYEPATNHNGTQQYGQSLPEGDQATSHEDLKKANAVSIQGKSWSLPAVGILAVNLSGLSCFEKVKLHSVARSAAGPIDFSLTAYTGGEEP